MNENKPDENRLLNLAQKYHDIACSFEDSAKTFRDLYHRSESDNTKLRQQIENLEHHLKRLMQEYAPTTSDVAIWETEIDIGRQYEMVDEKFNQLMERWMGDGTER